MSRPTVAHIDLDALRHNLGRVRELAPGRRVMAVVKADAYGHGLQSVARALSGRVEAFGVACLEEALELREADIADPVVLLEGVFDARELPELVRHRLQAVIHQPSQWQSLKTFRPSTAIPVWLKLDTGMHRLGLSPEQLGSLYAEMSAHPSVRVEGFMSHLANADDSNDQFTRYQLADFRDHCGEFGLPLSLANSAAICAWPDTHLDWVRPGLMLYGASPLAGRNAAQLGLRPVMRLVSELMAVRQLAVGDPVGYGGSWVCPEAMPVGIVACGYGDGYPRHAVNGTSVSVGGQRVPLVGRVSMDMLAVDLRQCPHAVPGTPVELWGLEPEVNTVATQAGTVGYELLCAVSARVPRQVHGA